MVKVICRQIKGQDVSAMFIVLEQLDDTLFLRVAGQTRGLMREQVRWSVREPLLNVGREQLQ